jgi:hypothetical protein
MNNRLCHPCVHVLLPVLRPDLATAVERPSSINHRLLKINFVKSIFDMLNRKFEILSGSMSPHNS